MDGHNSALYYLSPASCMFQLGQHGVIGPAGVSALQAVVEDEGQEGETVKVEISVLVSRQSTLTAILTVVFKVSNGLQDSPNIT